MTIEEHIEVLRAMNRGDGTEYCRMLAINDPEMFAQMLIWILDSEDETTPDSEQ